MLFVLTGKVQTGKTRWLQALVESLEEGGVSCVGVLAPGVWRERSAEELEAMRAFGDESPVRFEKLGFNNVLLPGGEVVPMARRRDLAEAEGAVLEGSQSSKANLSWEMSEGALDRVNDHLASLAGGVPEPAAPRLLVIDEVGRLELLHNGGLTAALDMLDAGPGELFEHVLIVVREALIEQAENRFGEVWGGLHLIAADQSGADALRAAFGLFEKP